MRLILSLKSKKYEFFSPDHKRGHQLGGSRLDVADSQQGRRQYTIQT